MPEQEHVQVIPADAAMNIEDARLYASWGVDYVKYDWCNTGSANAQETYRTFGSALLAAGRPMILSMCEWGTAKPWEWAAQLRSYGELPAIFRPRYSTNAEEEEAMEMDGKIFSTGRQN